MGLQKILHTNIESVNGQWGFVTGGGVMYGILRGSKLLKEDEGSAEGWIQLLGPIGGVLAGGFYRSVSPSTADTIKGGSAIAIGSLLGAALPTIIFAAEKGEGDVWNTRTGEFVSLSIFLANIVLIMASNEALKGGR